MVNGFQKFTVATGLCCFLTLFYLASGSSAVAQSFDRADAEWRFLQFTLSRLEQKTASTYSEVNTLERRCGPPLFDDPEAIEACRMEWSRLLGTLRNIEYNILGHISMESDAIHHNLDEMISEAEHHQVGQRPNPLEEDVLMNLIYSFGNIWFVHRPLLTEWRAALNRELVTAVDQANSPAMQAIGASRPVGSLNFDFQYHLALPYPDFRGRHFRSAAQVISVAGVRWAVIRLMLRGGRLPFGPADTGKPSLSSPPYTDDSFKNYEFLDGPFAIELGRRTYDVDLSKYPKALRRSLNGGTYQSKTTAGLVYETIPVSVPKPFVGFKLEDFYGVPIHVPFVLPSGWSICADQSGSGGDIEHATEEQLDLMITVMSDGQGGQCITIPMALPWGFQNGSKDPFICTTMPHVENNRRPYSFHGCHNLVTSINTPPTPESIGQLTPLDEQFLIMHSPGYPGGTGFVELLFRFNDRYSNPNPTKPACFEFFDYGTMGSAWKPIRPTPPGCDTESSGPPIE